MEIVSHTCEGTSVAEIVSDAELLNSEESALELLGNLYYQGFDAIILSSGNLSASFYDLKTRLAGDVLQKFSNYRMRLAVVGDFNLMGDDRFTEFMRESNQGNLIYFTDSLEVALRHLSR